MTTHHFTSKLSNLSSPIEFNHINTEKKPSYEKTFVNRITGEKFERNDVQIALYKRNKVITEFFKKYNSNSKYSMIEIGFDFALSEKASTVLLKVNRNLKKMKTILLGNIWLVDRGENGKMHFHLVIALEKQNYQGKTLPKELKFCFKTKKIHSAFVTNKPKMRDYLLKKKIYFIGKRKRVFGKSRFFYENSKNAELQINARKLNKIEAVTRNFKKTSNQIKTN